MTEVVLIAPFGVQADQWQEVIHHLPAGWSPRIPALFGETFEEQVKEFEKYLDKHELRQVVVVGVMSGAALGATIPERRLAKLIAVQPVWSVDPKVIASQRKALKFVPKFVNARRRKLLEEQLNYTENLDVTALVELLGDKVVEVPDVTAQELFTDARTFAEKVFSFL